MPSRLSLPFAALCLLIPAAAAAATWEVVATSSEAALQIDTESIGAQGAFTKAWTMRTYKDPIAGEIPAKPYRSSKQLVLLDCAKRTMGVSQIINYAGPAGAGEVVEATRFMNVERFDVQPGSFAERVFERACDRPKPVEKPKAAK